MKCNNLIIRSYYPAFCALIFFIFCPTILFGQTWKCFGQGIPDGRVDALLSTDDSIMIASVSNDYSQGIYYRQDSVTPFIKNASAMIGEVSQYVKAHFTLFAATQYGLYISKDDGITWHLKTIPHTTSSTILGIYADHDTVYVNVTNSDYTFKSTDGGITWESTGMPQFICTPIIDSNIVYWWSTMGLYVMTSHDTTIKYPSVSYYDFTEMNGRLYTRDGGNVYQSNDSGTTWNSVLATSVECMTKIDTSLFIGLYGGLYQSDNNGNNWRNVSTGLPVSDIRQIAYNGQYIIVSTNNSRPGDSGIYAVSYKDMRLKAPTLPPHVYTAGTNVMQPRWHGKIDGLPSTFLGATV